MEKLYYKHLPLPFYVYIHKSKETGEVLYVGSGEGRRATSGRKKSYFLDKDVEIIEYFSNKEDSIKFEEYFTRMLQEVGQAKLNDKLGNRHPEELKQKWSKNKKGVKKPKDFGIKMSELAKSKSPGKHSRILLCKLFNSNNNIVKEFLGANRCAEFISDNNLHSFSESTITRLIRQNHERLNLLNGYYVISYNKNEY
ncbi:MAG TPA: hypothetical protein VK190_04580 [Pseudoneobacillus sp.]|nr:hypothetical protein [Pseudoneobacillus sp.]